jgi:hypothetical protein
LRSGHLAAAARPLVTQSKATLRYNDRRNTARPLAGKQSARKPHQAHILHKRKTARRGNQKNFIFFYFFQLRQGTPEKPRLASHLDTKNLVTLACHLLDTNLPPRGVFKQTTAKNRKQMNPVTIFA